MLEAIGLLAIIFGGIYLYLRSLTNKEREERKNAELIKFSEKSKSLIRDYNSAVSEGKPIITHYELRKQLNRIMNDPQEHQSSIEKMEKNTKADEDLRERFNQITIGYRKVGYLYEIAIFEIFDTRRALQKSQIIPEIQKRFSMGVIEAEGLMKVWKENSLIRTCSWDENLWEVGETLSSESYQITKYDMTRNKWLETNGKRLEPESQEEKAYWDNFDDEMFGDEDDEEDDNEEKDYK